MKALLALAGLGGLVMPPQPAWANSGQSIATGMASATVIEPLSVHPLQDLEFGVIAISGRSAGTVIVEPGLPGAHYAGGIRAVCAAGCASPQSARFEVRGEAGRSYVITVPNRVSSLGVSASQQLHIVAIRARIASHSGQETVGEINFSGFDYFDLGGTLIVPLGIAPAHYRLNLPVMMAYN